MADQTTPEQEIVILECPAHYANKFFMSFFIDGVKIVFAEESLSGNKAVRPRCAVFLSQAGVAQLKELCEHTLKVVKEREGNASQVLQ